MMRISRFLLLGLVFVAAKPLCAQLDIEDLAKLFPSGMDVYVGFRQTDVSLSKLRKNPLYRSLDSNGFLQQVYAAKGFQPIAKLWQSLNLKGAALLGMEFNLTGPEFLMVAARPQDFSLKKLAADLKAIDPKFVLSARGQEDGVDWCSLKNIGYLAAGPKLLFWSTTRELVADMKTRKPEDSWALSAGYQLAIKEQHASDILICADLSKIVQAKDLDAKRSEEFLNLFLFDSFAEDIKAAVFGSAWLDVRNDRLDLRIRLLNKKARAKNWHLAHRNRHALPPLRDQMGSLHIDRDIAEFWQQRMKIVPEGGQQAVAKLAQDFNVILAGFPFSDVMAILNPGFDIVATPVKRSEDHPDLLLPQFALIFNANFNSDQRNRFRVAFQTAISIVNAESAQEKRQPLLQFSKIVSGVEILTARFLDDPIKGRRPTHYNFRPALAFVDSKLVIATDIDLAAQLVAKLQEKTTLTSARGDHLYLCSQPIHAMLTTNREFFVEQRIIEEGETDEEAEAFVDTILNVLESTHSLSIRHIALEKSTTWDFVLRSKKKPRMRTNDHALP